MKKAIVLLSGGMDSLVTLAVALKENEVYPLHVNYRNRTEKKELDCFEAIVAHYGLKSPLVTDIDYLRKIGGSSLTDETIEIERGWPDKTGVPSSYIPFRNTHLLSIAVSYAEVTGARSIFLGAVEDDSSGYPDCTKEYIQAFNRLVHTGSKVGEKLKVYAPLIDMDKREIVTLGSELKVPFELSWSCYESGDLACGTCHSCFLRKRAFEKASKVDPIRYRSIK